jgi:hypothetical protein
MINLKNLNTLAILSVIICSISSTVTPVRSEDRCSVPTLPGIDVSKVRIVKNAMSRDPSIEQYIRQEHEHANAINSGMSASYSYNKVDLDGDGKPEVLLRVSSSSCGTGGCPIEILKFNGNRYSVIDSFLSFGNFIFTSNKTNGFKDMVLPYFRPMENKYLLLRYQASAKGYRKVREYTNNFNVQGTAYLVCGESFTLSK